MPAVTRVPRRSRVSPADSARLHVTLVSVSADSSLLGPRRRGSITGRALVLAIVLVVLAVMLAMPIKTWFAQRAQISGLEADVEAAKAKVASLQVQKQRWNDPSFVAAEARRRLHFVLPGEVGYVTLGADGKPLDGTVNSTTPVKDWYGTLITGLKEADNAVTPE